MDAPPRLPGSYLVVELTNRCDLACVHCVQSQRDHPHFRRRGLLEPELFEALLADLAATGAGFDTLILFWLGEPLLHPRFTELYRAALRHNHRHRSFGKLEVHTNATLLDERVVRAVLNRASTPQVWHLGLDATEPSTYRRIKGRDRLERVEENARRLLREKARLGAPWPRVVLQFVLSHRNVDEAAAFRYRWERWCRQLGLPVRAAAGGVPPGDDTVIFYRQVDCPTPEEQARENRIFRATASQLGLEVPPDRAPPQVEARNLQPCSGFWKSPVISWDGRLTVCTRDSELALAVGDLHEQPFSALWWGPEMAGRRRRVARGDYRGLPPCETCFIPRSANYTAITPIEIARHARWEAARAREEREP